MYLLALIFLRMLVKMTLPTLKMHRAAWLGQRVDMRGGSTNKLTAAGFERASKKASTFNAAQFSLVGNNATGANMFGRNKF